MNAFILDVGSLDTSRGSSEQTPKEFNLSQAEVLIESVIEELRREDRVAVDYTVEDVPAVTNRSWDMRVGLPVLLIASIISAALVYGILFVLPRFV